MHFRKMCEKYPDLLKYVESTILDQVKEKMFMHGMIKLDTMEIQQLTELSLPMLL